MTLRTTKMNIVKTYTNLQTAFPNNLVEFE